MAFFPIFEYFFPPVRHACPDQLGPASVAVRFFSKYRSFICGFFSWSCFPFIKVVDFVIPHLSPVYHIAFPTCTNVLQWLLRLPTCGFFDLFLQIVVTGRYTNE